MPCHRGLFLENGHLLFPGFGLLQSVFSSSLSGLGHNARAYEYIYVAARALIF